ncbi:MAG: subclass B3 metallo-beta-lactamase [Pseudomonadales bacterium]|jgi:metallo-beta-lactamase class B
MPRCPHLRIAAHLAAASTLLVALSGTALAATPSIADFEAPQEWTKPFPAFHVIGNLYGVGTWDLSSFLITSDAGHILINTGLADSTAQIRENVESLGFRLEDVRILLSQQAHFDHTAALAEIKALTGAEMWATARDKRILEDGGFSDPHFGGAQSFTPVAVDRVLSDGDTIELGDISLTVHDHPGHTEGSSSYTMRVREAGRDYEVVIANMGTINPGKRLLVNPTYPGVADDFARTFSEQKAMPVDVWVAAHGSQYGLHDKYRPGQEYSPDTFVDPDGFRAEVSRLEALYLEQMAAERAEAAADGT